MTDLPQRLLQNLERHIESLPADQQDKAKQIKHRLMDKLSFAEDPQDALLKVLEFIQEDLAMIEAQLVIHQVKW
jgi:hypothetical protein